MANLGSDDTPIVGESFGLPSGWSITENGDGEVVIEDSGANVVFRRDETAGEWVTDSIDAESVSTEQLDTPGLVGLSQADIDDHVKHQGFSIALDGEWHTVFDIDSPVDVWFGQINGPAPSGIRVTFSDDSTETIGGTSGSGNSSAGGTSEFDTDENDQNDNRQFGSLPVPAIDDVKKFEFRATGGAGAGDYGYWVVTN